MEIAQSTVAIFGSGSVGTTIAEKLKGMGVKKVIGISRSGRANEAFDETVALESYGVAIDHADYIVSVMPENQESVGFWTLDRFKQMRPNCVFINIGRGSAVVLKDIQIALKNRIISGAALDVTEPEPIPSWSRIRKCRRLIITNHMSAFSQHNQARMEQLMLNQLEAMLCQTSIRNCIHIES